MFISVVCRSRQASDERVFSLVLDFPWYLIAAWWERHGVEYASEEVFMGGPFGIRDCVDWLEFAIADVISLTTLSNFFTFTISDSFISSQLDVAEVRESEACRDCSCETLRFFN